jgi:hypothetical protein
MITSLPFAIRKTARDDAPTRAPRSTHAVHLESLRRRIERFVPARDVLRRSAHGE